MMADGVSQTVMTGLPLTSHVRSLSACSLGAFSTTEPVVIEECTENYPVKIEDIVATDDTYSESQTGDTVHGNEDKLIVTVSSTWCLIDKNTSRPARIEEEITSLLL